MCFAFPDMLGTSAEESTDGSPLIVQLFLCWYEKPIVSKSNGGIDNIRMHWRFNYTYHNSNVLFCEELFGKLF